MKNETENDEFCEDLNIPCEDKLDSNNLNKLNSTNKYCLKVEYSPSKFEKSEVVQIFSPKKDIRKNNKLKGKVISNHKKIKHKFYYQIPNP